MTAPGSGGVVGQAIIQIIPDVKRFATELRRQLHAASMRMRSLQRDIAPVNRALRFMAKNATGIAPGIKLASAAFRALAGEAIVGGILALGGAAYELAGTLLLLPAGALAAGAAMGTLAVGLRGVRDALKKFDDPEKFREIVSQLSKEAQKALLALDRLRPRIVAFRNAVQDALFSGMDRVFGNLVSNVLPIVQKNFTDLARIFNQGGKDLAAFVQQASTLSELRSISGNITEGFRALLPAIKPASQAILDLVSVGSEFLPQIGERVAELATQFSEFISRARQSGQLAQWIAGGLRVLEQLGRIIGNLAIGLHALLSTAKAAGLGLVDSIEKASQAFRNFFTSVRGQNAVVEFLHNAKLAAQTLLPIIGAVAEVFFGHLIPALVQVGHVLGPGVTTFIHGLGEAIDAARPGVVEFAEGFNFFLTAITPALPAIGEFIGAVGRLVGALSAGFGPAIADIVQALSSLLVPVLTFVADIVSLLPESFFKFIAVLGVLVGAIGAVIAVMRSFIAFGSLFASAVGVAATATLGLTRAVTTFSSFMRGPWGIALTAAIALLGAFALSHSEADDREASLKASAADLNQAIREQNGLIDENIRRKAAQQLEDAGALQFADQLGISTGRLTDAYVNQGPALDNVVNQLKSMIDGENLAVAAQNAGTDAHARQVTAAAQLLGILLQLKGGREADAAAQERVTAATNTATGAVERQRDAYYGLIDAQRAKADQDLAGINSQIDYQRQLATTRTELAEGTKTLNLNTKEGQDNMAALTALVSRGNARIAQLKAEKAPITEVNKALQQQERDILGLLTPYFKSRAAARAFAVQLGLIPRKTVAQIILEDKAARAAAISFARLADYAARDRISTVRFNVIGNAQAAAGVPTGGFPRAAIGGRFDPGDFAVVGERGPELVAFGRSARVFSHRDSLAMTSTDDELAQLNRVTTRRPTSAYAPTPTTATTETAPPVVQVDVQPEVHVYLGGRSLDPEIERVVVARDRYTSRVVRATHANVRRS